MSSVARNGKQCSKCYKTKPNTSEFFAPSTRLYCDGPSKECWECRNSRTGVRRHVPKARRGYKFCSKCGEEKPADLEHFNTAKKSVLGLSSQCKACIRAKSKAKLLAAREARKAAKAALFDGTQRCTRCGEKKPATTEYFHIRRSTASGLKPTCKACVKIANAEQIDKRRKRPAVLPPPGVLKVCSACGEEKPADLIHFRRNSYNVDCLSNHCRTCNLEKDRAYAAANPLIARVKMNRRRARLKKVGGTFTKEDVQRQLENQNSRCYWCGDPLKKWGQKGFHVDHIIPISKGGSNGPENICCACSQCNLVKHNKMPHEFIGRLF